MKTHASHDFSPETHRCTRCTAHVLHALASYRCDPGDAQVVVPQPVDFSELNKSFS